MNYRFGSMALTRCAVGVVVFLAWAGSAFAQGRTLEGVWGVVTRGLQLHDECPARAAHARAHHV